MPAHTSWVIAAALLTTAAGPPRADEPADAPAVQDVAAEAIAATEDPHRAAPEDLPEAPQPGEVDDPRPAMGPDEPSTRPAAVGEDVAARPRIQPPRVDGPYLGGGVAAGTHLVRVLGLDTPQPLTGGVAHLATGQSIFRWMTLGVDLTFGAGFVGSQRVLQGGLVADFGFYPVPRRPLSIRAGFGFGFGAVRDGEVPGRRFGFGGPLFRLGTRYEFFPTAARRRPTRGGGWAIGPELIWLAYTPNRPDGPMGHVITLGVYSAIYFGE